MSSVDVVSMLCSRCNEVFDQTLTDELCAPACPGCGYVGNREVSRTYPLGVLAHYERDSDGAG